MHKEALPVEKSLERSPQAAKSFPCRQIKRNSIAKVVYSQEHSVNNLTVTSNNITVKPPMSPTGQSRGLVDHISTNPINTKPNSAEKASLPMQIDDAASTVNNSL